MTSRPSAQHGSAPPVPMRRIALASWVGTTIEYYDFLIYGTAAALVFPTVFFPALGSAAATLASIGTFAVAFVARPLGAVVFGHFGDRIGRKRTLIATLSLMGAATVVIGLLPGAATIGVAAPIVLILLRILQGVALGGEWAGAVLLAAEYAPVEQRGRYGMYPQLGSGSAFVLASLTFVITTLALGDNPGAFVEYGWRIPFVASAVLIAVGLYVRLKIEETPVFVAEKTRQMQRGVSDAAPFRELFRHQTREVLLGAGAVTMVSAFFFIGTVFLTSYATGPGGIGMSRLTVLTLNVIGGMATVLAVIWSANYSDRVGRRRVIILSCVLFIIWSLLLFPVIDTGSPVAFAIALAITLGLAGFAYGPFGAAMPEMFMTRHRYTGVATSFNIGGILGGGIAPLLAAPIGAAFGSFAIGVFMALIALLSLVCSWKLGETRGRVLTTTEPAAESSATGSET